MPFESLKMFKSPKSIQCYPFAVVDSTDRQKYCSTNRIERNFSGKIILNPFYQSLSTIGVRKYIAKPFTCLESCTVEEV